ncbi:hypothetical protein [Yinghuangia soli]|uniref:LPXTG cell wall anchor domain-containing protein n=1 Tax=Yinghuangia soli TaxID=2908204 RepID=A0AA41Q932_9ACTN|nr:hypothetical protein [Yinghuangia soli]MCF2533853.1 hypothetical protein [Yinghuangia soli]
MRTASLHRRPVFRAAAVAGLAAAVVAVPAGAAFAADAPAPKPPTAGVPDAKTGTVKLTDRVSATLSNGKGGPKAVVKLTADAADGTKAGTVIGTLTKANQSGSYNGLTVRIAGADGSDPTLVWSVEGQGGEKSAAFPKAEAPKPDQKVTPKPADKNAEKKAEKKAEAKKDAPAPKKDETAKPKGGVAAGGEHKSNDDTLLYAGAGAAAVGAAGLGFVMLRRRSTDQG